MQTPSRPGPRPRGLPAIRLRQTLWRSGETDAHDALCGHLLSPLTEHVGWDGLFDFPKHGTLEELANAVDIVADEIEGRLDLMDAGILADVLCDRIQLVICPADILAEYGRFAPDVTTLDDLFHEMRPLMLDTNADQLAFVKEREAGRKLDARPVAAEVIWLKSPGP